MTIGSSMIRRIRCRSAAAGSPEEPRQLDGGCVQHLAANAREGGELDRGLPWGGGQGVESVFCKCCFEVFECVQPRMG